MSRVSGVCLPFPMPFENLAAESLWDCKTSDFSGVPFVSHIARNFRKALPLILILFGWVVPNSSVASDWKQRENYRIASLGIPLTGETGFTLITNQAQGIFFTNTLSLARA